MNSEALPPSFPRSCEVLILGAGPAGMAAALAQAGHHKVLLVDRRRAPWRKPCDGILTPMSLRGLAQCGIEVQARLQTRPAERIRVIDRDNGTQAMIPLAGHQMVDRQELDTLLRQSALAAPGVALLDQCLATDWQAGSGGFEVRLWSAGKTATLRARCVIDATGAAAATRRKAGAPLPTGIAAQLWFPPQGDPGRCDWSFDRALTPYYLWAIHKPSGLVLGGLFPAGQPRLAYTVVREILPRQLAIHGQPWRSQMAAMALPACEADIRLDLGPYLILGEAAGLVNAGTGEGLSFAIRSGLACGHALASVSDPVMAAGCYVELAASLIRETLIKARQAQVLFDPVARSRLRHDEHLVPIPRHDILEPVDDD